MLVDPIMLIKEMNYKYVLRPWWSSFWHHKGRCMFQLALSSISSIVSDRFERKYSHKPETKTLFAQNIAWLSSYKSKMHHPEDFNGICYASISKKAMKACTFLISPTYGFLEIITSLRLKMPGNLDLSYAKMNGKHLLASTLKTATKLQDV